MNRRKPQPPKTSLRPSLDLHAAQYSFFVYHGHIYAVATAPSPVFAAMVREHAPRLAACDQSYAAILDQATLLLVDRWWLLCELIDAGRGITLYASEEDAMEMISSGTS